jgi:hypothetical protein
MNGMTHKQAIKLIHRRQDGLLRGDQEALLDEHLHSCDSCRAYSDEMILLSSNLKREFKAHWDGDAGPSQNMTGNVLTKAKGIPAAKQISFNFRLLSGTIVLILLALAINFVISSLQNASLAQNSRTPASTSTTNLMVDPQICKPPQGESVPSELYGLDVIQNTSYTNGDFTYDFWLYCDPALNPDDPEHLSAIAGLGIYSSWHYTGPQVDGPVRYHYAFEPDQPFGESGSDGPLYKASAAAKFGIDLSKTQIREHIQQGSPIQFSTIVNTSLGQDGAVLSFVLEPAEQGYKISNVKAEKLTDSNEGLIAFTAIDKTGNTDIFTSYPDGSGLTNLTNNPATESNLAWSPDGTRLAFVSDLYGKENIHIINADGSNLTTLTDAPGSYAGLLWSPDGQKIAFSNERTGNADILVMDADGGNLTRLTDNPGPDRYFYWSPDGKRIIYDAGEKDNDQKGQLVLIDEDGSHKTILTEPGSYIFLGWSPDSQNIVYLKQNLETGNAADSMVAVSNTDGTGYHEWNFIVDRILWEDDQHFIGDGWNGRSERPDWAWVLNRFSTNGDPPVEIASHSSRIVEILRDTHVVGGGSTLAWYTSDGSPTPFTSWNSSEVCRGTGDQFMPSNWTSTAPDESKALIVIPCQSGEAWFYVNPLDGSPVRKLTDFSLDDARGGGPMWIWSPDGKYGIMLASSPGGGQGSDLYLFDVEQMLKDPSLRPIRFASGEGINAAWQPVP